MMERAVVGLHVLQVVLEKLKSRPVPRIRSVVVSRVLRPCVFSVGTVFCRLHVLHVVSQKSRPQRVVCFFGSSMSCGPDRDAFRWGAFLSDYVYFM